jgi:hypothetical protein
MKIRSMRLRKANPVSLSGLMTNVVRELKCDKDFYVVRLKKDWKNIVGETNARNIQPLTVDNDILIASVSSPVWLTEFQFSKKKLLEKINQYKTDGGEKIHDIRFVLDKSL